MKWNSWVNKYSWKSFLSKLTKEINQGNGFYWFKIRNTLQVLKDRPLNSSDLDFLDDLAPFNFFYFSEEDIKLLENRFKIKKSKDPDIGIRLDCLNFSGRDYRDIRNYINRYSNRFQIRDDFDNIDDIFKMIKRWNDTCGKKYFQVRSGKDKYFFINKFHHDCINLFIYDKNDLISYAILSPGENGSYIIRKALCLDYPGLTEFTDIEIYKKAAANGVKVVNLGGGSSNVRKYKKKFPGSFENPTYDGKVISKK